MDINNNPLTLFCLVDGDAPSRAFCVDIDQEETVGHLKDLIKAKKSKDFSDIDANMLTLWRVSIPDDNLSSAITVDVLGDKTELKNPRTSICKLFSESSYDKPYILVQRPPSELGLSTNKKRRITEGWKQYTASDGKVVDLPPSWIDILASTEFVPEPRAAFDHLKHDLQAGDAIIIPSMGQTPKDFGFHGQGHSFFVTEQMLALWEDMHRDQQYAGVLDKNKQDESTLEVLKRFLAMNKDILTGAEFEMMARNYNGKDDISTDDISTDAISVIFQDLLKSKNRKTLLLVDEHCKLYKEKPYVPDKFKVLAPLNSYHWWGEDVKGSRVIFTGTTHAKYNMRVLEERYRLKSLVFVGPLSRHVFSKLLDTHPRLAGPAIREEVEAITNCVPRELVYLSAAVKHLPDPISLRNLQKWTRDRTKDFQSTAKGFYDTCTPFMKGRFYDALLRAFLGCTDAINFHPDFLDLGLVYRCEGLVYWHEDYSRIRTQHRILCRPAQRALLELFKMRPLPETINRRIYDGGMDEVQFMRALSHQLICTNEPIELDATDLNGKKPATILLDFSDDTIQDQWSLGFGHNKVTVRDGRACSRFNFMLGPVLIQVSDRDFGYHNSGSTNLSKAFNVRDDNGTNQIERYLNDLYGPNHSAIIKDNRFVVTRDGVPLPGFRVVYIRGSPGNLSDPYLVEKYPDVRHVTFEEVREKLLKNVTYGD
ncbi:hypothetical protein BGZ95_001195 [Linnemannia exigua]|uniref:Crinkler effector protein N-terminal domain-containing protein n=1 Tax=Linnemannia exigua TaxID=604196 RepID=A0AAD4D9C4_9FUNG|nr:hypothetical protein BGZ95_001195 [Linnemannia exigua]